MPGGGIPSAPARRFAGCYFCPMIMLPPLRTAHRLLLGPVLLLLLILSAPACTPAAQSVSVDNNDQLVHIGTYTRTEGHVDGQADGIYSAIFDTKLGQVKNVSLRAEVTNPSFLARSTDGAQLLAVSELAHADEPTGFLHAYDVADDGALTETAKLPTNRPGTLPRRLR